MKMEWEVMRREQAVGDADALLYTPLHLGIGVKHSRIYHVEIEGDADKARESLLGVLLDHVSQEWRDNIVTFAEGTQFVLDYGMKAGALDLEKEAIMTYYRRLSAQGFELKSLRIQQRFAFFGEAAVAHAPQFVKDVVNPAVHQHQLKILITDSPSSGA